MNKTCEDLVREADKLLGDSTRYSFRYTADRIYEQGYVDGKAAAQKILRFQLGLATPEDQKE